MKLEQILHHDRAASQKVAQQANRRLLPGLLRLASHSGDSRLWALVIALLLWQKPAWGWPLLVAVALTAVVVTLIKGVFKRKRPGGPGRRFAAGQYAFPSGHAARCGAIAATFASLWPELWLLWLAWAALVAVARVALSHHFLSDVGSGLLLGLLIGAILL